MQQNWTVNGKLLICANNTLGNHAPEWIGSNYSIRVIIRFGRGNRSAQEDEGREKKKGGDGGGNERQGGVGEKEVILSGVGHAFHRVFGDKMTRARYKTQFIALRSFPSYGRNVDLSGGSMQFSEKFHIRTFVCIEQRRKAAATIARGTRYLATAVIYFIIHRATRITTVSLRNV